MRKSSKLHKPCACEEWGGDRSIHWFLKPNKWVGLQLGLDDPLLKPKDLYISGGILPSLPVWDFASQDVWSVFLKAAVKAAEHKIK